MCDFCEPYYRDELKDRIWLERKELIVAIPRNPSHEFHLLIFNSSKHVKYLHDYSDKDIVALKDLMKDLNSSFSKNLSGYRGYNLSSNNGEESIGQTVEHAHIHMFMRFSSEANSPFVNMAKGNHIQPKDNPELLNRYRDIFSDIN